MSNDIICRILHNIGKLTARIHEASQKWLTKELEAVGLNMLVPSHGDVLAYLFGHEEATMHELADFAHRTRPTMTVLVDKMVELGLVERRKSTNDSRSQIVSLTPEGESLRPVFEEISERFVAMLYAGVSELDAAKVEKTLSKILSNTEKGNNQ